MGDDIPWDATFVDTRDPDDTDAAVRAAAGRGRGRGPGSRGGRPRNIRGLERQPAAFCAHRVALGPMVRGLE